MAISPNSRFLYATAYSKVYQYDLEAADIAQSRVLIAEHQFPPGLQFQTRFYQARLAPDGKIYISGTNTHNHLHVIHHPNCKGLDAELEQYAIKIPSLNDSTMPNLPHFRNWEVSDTCEIMVSNQNRPNKDSSNLRIYPNPSNGIINIELSQHVPAIISLSDAYGKAVYKVKVVSSNYTLDISDLANGIYFVTVYSKSIQDFTTKIVVLK